MRIYTRLSRAAAAPVLLVAASTLTAAQAKKFPLDAVLPLAADIKARALPNGLKFYITKKALADFGGGLTLDPKEVEKERGVVIEEWRGGLGAGSRIRDKQIPIIFYKSRYADRLPIGKPEIIRGAPVARLRAFYDTWYRPERMAVVAVGDIDPAAMQTAISSTFGPLRDRAKAEKGPDGKLPITHPVMVT